MKRLLIVLAILICVGSLSGTARAQDTFPPLRVKEADGSPDAKAVREIRVTNGKLTQVSAGIVSLDLAGNPGTVTSVSVVTANGISGSVATATTTPAITLTLGAITPSTIIPTGMVTLRAGATAAGTAPLKFQSGSLNTTAEAGAVEFLTDKWYGTITTGAARKTFAFLESPALITPDLGTPSAAVLTSATGLPISTGVSGLGANVAAFLATPSSDNLAAAVTDETGTLKLVLSDSPVFTTGITTPAVILSNDGQLNVASGIAPYFKIDNSATAPNNGATFQFNAAAAHTATSGGLADIGSFPGFNPAAGSASFAALHLNPSINASGAQTGTFYGLGVAVVATNLNGGTLNLIDVGTTTSTLFSGYTSKFKVDNSGNLTMTGALSGATTINAVTGYQIGGAAASGNRLMGNGTNFVSTALAGTQSTPADPSTTTSTTGVMMGLAGTVTPTGTGRVLIVISGDIDNDTLGDGCKVQIRTGTGAAPANGDALTGTTRGGLTNFLNPNIATLTVGRGQFSLNAVVSSLTLSTAVWVDVSLAAVTGGVARIRNLSISTAEF